MNIILYILYNWQFHVLFKRSGAYLIEILQ